MTSTAGCDVTAVPGHRTARPNRADIVAAGAAVGLFTSAVVVGAVLYLAGRPVHASSAPLTAHWLTHAGPGTPAAIAIAALVVWQGPRLAAALHWRWLLAGGYVAALAWMTALALVDGWQRGFAGRLTTSHEYVSQVGRVSDVAAMLRGFTGRILDFHPDSWTTHVAGHPPGAFLVFIGLDHAGLGGGAWAATVCVLAGALVTVAVPVTVRALGGEPAARATIPFLVLFPGAIWMGVSADGMFAGVTSTGLALLAIAVTRRNLAAGLAAGILLTGGIYLSYGLVLIVLPALAVVLLARSVRRRAIGALAAALTGAAAVVAAFTLAGFWWLDGYHLVVQRYYQGVAAVRPYGYWVWANLALVVVSAGPIAAVISRRAARTALSAARNPQNGGWSDLGPVVVLPLAALTAIVAADLTGLSKAEVERIWLPFVVWFIAGAALLPAPDRRFWLTVQAALALLLNHLLLTTW